MRKWTSVLALAVVGALVTTVAFAQTGGGSTSSSTSSDTSTSTSGGASGGMKSDTGKSASDTGMKSDMSKGRGTRGGDREQVRAVQQALKDKGHDPGTVDGVMGPKTRSALRDFQKKEGIKDTGRLDQETMSKLGVEGAKTSGGGSSSTGTSASPATSTSGSSGSSSGPSGADKK